MVPQPLVTAYLMVSTPAATPVAMPVEVTVAMLGYTLLHVPPIVVLLSVMLAPVQTLVGPLMLFTVGYGLTVTA